MNDWGLTAAERRALRRLSSPVKIQAFLDEIPYNLELDGDTMRSPRRVLRDRTAHCFEGAILAAAALRISGEPPLVVDLEAVRDDDHVLAVYRQDGLWGSVAISKFAGLRFREPVYRSVRELVLSYFDHYYNDAGEKTLRAYSRPVDLSRFDRISWMTTEADLWPIAAYLARIPHIAILPPSAARRRRWMDPRLRAAGLLGYPRGR
jgi:hypothetical protein